MYSAFGRVEADVVIIGGGLSGLTAAHTILSVDPALSVYVLEASDYIGGRIKTIQLNTSGGLKEYDIGGQFVLESQWHLMNLCKKLNINIVPRWNLKGQFIVELTDGDVVKSDKSIDSLGNPFETYELINFLSKFEEISNQVSLGNPISISNYKELDIMTLQMYFLINLRWSHNLRIMNGIVTNHIGMSPECISVLFYAAYCSACEGIHRQMTFMGSKKESQLMLIEGGASFLLHNLKNFIGETYIKTNCCVKNIKNVFDGTIVKVSNGTTIRSRYVIVAIPPEDILNIDFEPPIRGSKKIVWEQTIAAKTVKFVVSYPNRFWEEDNLSGEIFCTSNPNIGPINVCYNVSTTNTAVLTGEIYNATGDKCYKEDVLVHLSKYFGRRALYPLDYKENNWLPSTGAFCRNIPLPNCMVDYRNIRKPMGRIFWAGTETATYWNGYMNGAIESGYRAGIEVLYDLRPQSLQISHILALNPKVYPSKHYQSSPANQWHHISTYKPLLCIGLLLLLFRKKIRRLIHAFIDIFSDN